MVTYFFLLLYTFHTTQTTASTPPYTPTDFILLSCGASSNLNDSSNRLWYTDERSKYAPYNGTVTISSSSTASQMAPSVAAVPYQTARVFHSPFTYTFPVLPGSKFLRLYFYPNTYSGYNTSQSFFSVTADAFTLLSNFSAYLYSKNSKEPSFMNEFIINVRQSQRLVLTISPNPDSFAFVNGIEIVSIPDKLYFQGNDVPIETAYQMINHLNNYTALENLYRLNVGGPYVDVKGDTGMFRSWSPDGGYIYYGDFGVTPNRRDVRIQYTDKTPAYSAPEIVYLSARMMGNFSISLEWGFPIDSGFFYLLRFHFCEFLHVTEQNQTVFSIYVSNQTFAGVIYWASGNQVPFFKDYLVWVPGEGRRKQDLRLSLYPYTGGGSERSSALLNGLEIFKLNDTKGSLAAANQQLLGSPPALTGIPLQQKKSGGSLIYAIIGSSIAVLALVAVLSFLISGRRRKVQKSTSVWVPVSTGSTSTVNTSGSGVSLPSDLCRYFSIDEIKIATRNFDDNFIIGRGGFGYVYKGLIGSAATTVAIKRLNPSSRQGAREFLTEIQMLSKLRHLHLVSLIGYCDEQGEMILVYDYMAHGSLRDHLYNSDNSPLSWNQRLQICMGAAKGLNYLHTGAEQAIIHRDVKSTNILLDGNWVAKISDFGLSKMGHTNDSFTHISTNVKGTFGYLDPKYVSTHQLTRKSDVYAFGVVLFEVLSGRPAVDVTLDEEQHSLAGWARYCVREGKMDQLIDLNLMGQISAGCMEVYVGIAGRCIRIQPLERPTMADVVMGLELALTLQPTTGFVEVEEGDNAGIVYSGQSGVVISMDDTTVSKGEADQMENNSSS